MDKVEYEKLPETLQYLADQFEGISKHIHRVLDPAKRYIRNVMNRELAYAGTSQFDAGELVFSAASYGATTNWKKNEVLDRACALLIEALPETGRLPTRRPFHSTAKGYRLIPIGCELTRSFAQLLQKVGYEFAPVVAHRLLNVFEEKLIELPRAKKPMIGWNFESAPEPDKPCIWVTTVAVIALDRIIRMLNERINTAVLRHFEVIRPDKLTTNLTLNELIYPDYGLSKHKLQQHSIAIRLEQMRAHLMRVALPLPYGSKHKVYSAILYGPPGTGKTTLMEAAASSSNVPLVRLSPSDLTVQGYERIERQALAIFEALSMLTKVAIIFDEFEPVLQSRERKDTGGSDSPPAEFRFLLTGILPKLIKLHEAAKKQSLVYCLATNHPEEIDVAAKREGRFDLLIPVYNPDPLSRAGALMYRLQLVAQRTSREIIANEKAFPTDGEITLNRAKAKNFARIVAATRFVPASRLAVKFFQVPERISQVGSNIETINLDEETSYFKFFWPPEAPVPEAKEQVADGRMISQEKPEERPGLRDEISAWIEFYENKIYKDKESERIWDSRMSDDEALSLLLAPP